MRQFLFGGNDISVITAGTKLKKAAKKDSLGHACSYTKLDKYVIHGEDGTKMFGKIQRKYSAI
jgi:hypothetical protein